MALKNYHACALEINKVGMLIKGRSGSGKTSLMMGLLERANQEKLNAFFISDDQVYLCNKDDRLEVLVPETIAGLIEIHGYGVISQPHRETSIVNLVIELIDDQEILRMPTKQSYHYEGLDLPLIQVPERHENQAVRIIFAWLSENPHLQVE